jgi:CRP-like cAMP-binding protein
MSLDSDIRHIGQVPILGRLDYDARRLLAFSAENKILHAGDVLFRRGEKSDGGYFIVSGSVALDYSKDDSRKVQIIGAGSLLGEMALVVETERAATAVAREPSRALKISRTLFVRVLEEYPEAAASIREGIAARVRGFVSELEKLRPI